MRFLTINRKTILASLLCVLCVGGVIATYFSVKVVSTPKSTYTIVIDAGHGGKDGGAVGVDTGVTESFLNLQYAKTLQQICEDFGWRVVMTRSDMNGLYSSFAQNKKKSEMEKRRKTIEKANPDIVVSIHMNSFPSSQPRGAQVYSFLGNEASFALAQSVQDSLHEGIDTAKKTAKEGDFFVLNCSSAPSILVECGFLSNAEEEKLLQEAEYRQKFCYQLFCGMLKFHSFS